MISSASVVYHSSQPVHLLDPDFLDITKRRTSIQIITSPTGFYRLELVNID